MSIQRETAREAATQTKPQELSAQLQSHVQQAGLQLIQNGVSGGQQAGYGGQSMKAQAKWELKPPTQGE
jgi:hypothetical protein